MSEELKVGGWGVARHNKPVGVEWLLLPVELAIRCALAASLIQRPDMSQQTNRNQAEYTPRFPGGKQVLYFVITLALKPSEEYSS